MATKEPAAGDSDGLDNAHDDQVLKLKSNDQQWFTTARFASYYSKYISMLLGGGPDLDYIILRAISGRELELIVDWFNVHGRRIPTYNIENAKQLINGDTISVVTDTHLMSIFGNEWDVSFIRSLVQKADGKDQLMRLIAGVRYTSIELLMTMFIISYCLFYPLEVIRIPNDALWYEWTAPFQCKFYGPARKEQFLLHVFNQIINTCIDERENDLLECLYWLIEKEEIYNYAIHRKLDLLLSSVDRSNIDFDFDTLASIVTAKQSMESIAKPHEKLVAGFLRQIDVYTPIAIQTMVQKWIP